MPYLSAAICRTRQSFGFAVRIRDYKSNALADLDAARDTCLTGSQAAFAPKTQDSATPTSSALPVTVVTLAT